MGDRATIDMPSVEAERMQAFVPIMTMTTHDTRHTNDDTTFICEEIPDWRFQIAVFSFLIWGLIAAMWAYNEMTCCSTTLTIR